VNRTSSYLTLLAAALGALTAACESGGVGDPCIPEDEYRTNFGGFGVAEVNAESRSFQCETRVCLVANFQGRVSCPYGNRQGGECYVPGTETAEANRVQEIVPGQLEARRASDAVYCSCRCDGPDKEASYCECPSGYSCQEMIEELGLGTDRQLTGSYCIKNGTFVPNPKLLENGPECNRTAGTCGEEQPFGL
jgi:hypothetical protein